MKVSDLRASKDKVSKFFLVKAMILVELQSSQPCLSSYHILKTPGHEIIKSWNCRISWTGRDPQGSLIVRVLSLHRTASRITPCAWEHCPNIAWAVADLMLWPLSWRACSSARIHLTKWMYKVGPENSPRSLLQSVGWEAPASWTQGVISVLKKTPAWFGWTIPNTYCQWLDLFSLWWAPTPLAQLWMSWMTLSASAKVTKAVLAATAECAGLLCVQWHTCQPWIEVWGDTQ